MAAVHVGNDKASLERQAEIVLQIVNSPAADKVKIVALRSITEAMGIKNISFNNVSADASTHHHYPVSPDSEPEPSEEAGFQINIDAT